MKWLFQYDPYKEYKVMSDLSCLDAFSSDEEGMIYYWQKSNFGISKLGSELDGWKESPRDFVVPYQFENMMDGSIQSVSGAEEIVWHGQAKVGEETVQTAAECIRYLADRQYIQKIMWHNMEDRVAQKLRAVLYLEGSKGGTVLIYLSGDGKKYGILIRPDIGNYDRLIEMLQNYNALHGTEEEVAAWDRTKSYRAGEGAAGLQTAADQETEQQPSPGTALTPKTGETGVLYTNNYNNILEGENLRLLPQGGGGKPVLVPCSEVTEVHIRRVVKRGPDDKGGWLGMIFLSGTAVMALGSVMLLAREDTSSPLFKYLCVSGIILGFSIFFYILNPGSRKKFTYVELETRTGKYTIEMDFTHNLKDLFGIFREHCLNAEIPEDPENPGQ